MSCDGKRLGAPTRAELSTRGLDAQRVELTLVLRGKPASRQPEAGFLTLTPAGAEAWQLHKMGLWHDGSSIVRRGGGQLQAVAAVRARLGASQLTATPLDAALMAPAAAPFIPFQPDRPDYRAGLRFNLYNNKWGTNFPMWWEGTVTFRFNLTLCPLHSDMRH